MSISNVSKKEGGAPGQLTLALALGLFLAIGADAALIAAAIGGHSPVAMLIAIHLLVGPAVWMSAKGSADSTLPTVALVAVTVLGPVGALGTFMLALCLAWPRRTSTSVRDWQRSLAKPLESDLPQRLSQAISEGRMFEPGRQSNSASFQQICDAGTVRQRYAVLGLISQRFDPRFTPALRSALKSDVAAVRVSAAAVYSKLRDKNRKEMLAARPIPDLLTSEDAAERGMILARGVMSGLLDPADLDAARKNSLELLRSARPEPTVADELEEVILALLSASRLDHELAERLQSLDPAHSSFIRRLKEQSLMRSGRYDEMSEVMKSGRGGAVRLNSVRSAANTNALLSSQEQRRK
jgi:hypothetical protein